MNLYQCFRSPLLRDYMQLVEDTESPRLYHVWCAIGMVAAALGRRCWFDFGIAAPIYPNHYILLVGNPSTKKSTAAAIMKRQLKAATGVRFAPADTAGQRQGLIKAMTGSLQHAAAEDKAVEELGRAGMELTLETLDNVTRVDIEDTPAKPVHADRHHILAVATEFSRFIGQNNTGMLDFLTPMWDGEEYEYQLKNELMVMKDPLVNIVGCTTPTSLAGAMPSAAEGQGFLSRMILVYGARKYKSIPTPKSANQDLEARVRDALQDIYLNMEGAFTETDAATEYREKLYDRHVEMSDARFSYYLDRRPTHLIKLTMVLAAMNRRMTITREDYEEADRILSATERGMPEALGQFGMNLNAQVKQSILEYIRDQGQPVSVSEIRAMFHRDARPVDITEILNDLSTAGHLKRIHTVDTNELLLSAVRRLKHVEDEILAALAET